VRCELISVGEETVLLHGLRRMSKTALLEKVRVSECYFGRGTVTIRERPPLEAITEGLVNTADGIDIACCSEVDMTLELCKI
jgi:hypothetical protein